MYYLDVGKRVFAGHVRIDIQFESPDVVHVLMVNLGLLHFVVKDSVLERLEHFVPHVKVDVQFLDIGDQVFANESAFGLVDLLQKVGFQHGNQRTLVYPYYLQLHLSDRLLRQMVLAWLENLPTATSASPYAVFIVVKDI